MLTYKPQKMYRIGITRLKYGYDTCIMSNENHIDFVDNYNISVLREIYISVSIRGYYGITSHLGSDFIYNTTLF